MLGLSTSWKAALSRAGADVFEPLLRVVSDGSFAGLVLDDGVSHEALTHLLPVVARGELRILALRGAALRPRPREVAVFEGEASPAPEAQQEKLPPIPRRRSRRDSWYSEAEDAAPAPSSVAALPPPSRGEAIVYERRARLASPEPDERDAAVAEHARTLEAASEHHVPILSVALGAVDPDEAAYLTLLRALTERETEALGRAHRASAPSRSRTFDGARFSLEALLARAEPLGVKVAVENAPLPVCLPSPEELFRLAATFAGAPLAYAHDVAAARLCAELGGPPGREYLDAGKARIAVAYLSDAKGTERGLVPGKGAIDFAGLAKVLPPCLRVLAPRPDWSARDVLEAAEHLRAADLG